MSGKRPDDEEFLLGLSPDGSLDRFDCITNFFLSRLGKPVLFLAVDVVVRERLDDVFDVLLAIGQRSDAWLDFYF